MRKTISRIWACGCMALAALLCCVACDSDVDIRQVYSFTVETMPVQTRITRGETAEIRCELRRAGRYDEARYTIRYFQPDGKARSAWTTARYFCPTTAIRSRGRCSAFTTPLHHRISRPSTSTSRTTSGNANNCHSGSTTRMRKRRSFRILLHEKRRLFQE